MINVTMSGNEDMSVTMDGNSEMSASMTETVVIDTRNHDELNHRDYASQHPMSAITGLVDALDDKADSEDVPTKTTDLTNDSGFITNSANDLINYYLKSGTYSKEEVNALISAVKQFTYELVAVLPTASASTMNKIYLVPSSQSEVANIKDEYITLDNGSEAQTRYTWEQIGSTAIDLSDYYTKSQTDSAIANHHDSTKQNLITNDNKLPYSLISGTPVIPTALSGFTDDLGSSPVHTHSQYLTEHQSLSGYATETWVGQQGFLTSHQDISGKEDKSNKKTSITSSSTDTDYPSAKAVYDFVGKGTLTIQRNGSTVDTFSANQNTNKTININGIPDTMIFNSLDAYDWYYDYTYSDFSYKCDIYLSDVTSSMSASVVFGLDEALSGYYAPVCDTGDGYVSIYSKIDTSITIPTITVWSE